MRKHLKKCVEDSQTLYMTVRELNPKFHHLGYLSANPDLEESLLFDRDSLELHYLLQGHEEGRITENIYHTTLDSLPFNFDRETYCFLNPDIIYNGSLTPEIHFKKFGYGEGRVWDIGMTYEELNQTLVEQDVFFDDDTIVLVNHNTSRTGAPFYLQDLANWLVDQGEKVVWLDIFPSDCFKLHKSIQKIYYFGSTNVLKDILDANNPRLIYSNSMTRMLIDWKVFQDYLSRTVIHLHETYPDVYRCFRSDRNQILNIISQSKATYFVAEKIMKNFNLPEEIATKCKLVPEFIHPERQAKILKTKKRKRKNKRVKIGMCGTVCSRKNPRLFALIAENNPDYDFIWIGGKFDHNIKNLSCIPVTQDPYKHLEKIDYFMLTSSRDPCPVVVLESLLMNHKIILLEGNIRYEHPAEDLENVIVIKDHKLNDKAIVEKFSELELNNEFNTTNKNRDYILENFTEPKIGDI